MNTLEKLKILGANAKWDSCGGTEKKNPEVPPEFQSVVVNCSSSSENCRLMKVLQSNACVHDCNYCINSCKASPKAVLEPSETARVFNHLARGNYVNGLFLTSAVTKSPEESAEQIIKTAEIVRSQGWNGYVHLKVLPGMRKDQIFRMAELADRLSVNIEAPSSSRFSELSSTKECKTDVLKRMRWIQEALQKLEGFGRIEKRQTTQFVVGSCGETDLEYFQSIDRLYQNFGLHRAYYSAFSPVEETGFAQRKAVPEKREFRLYQSDFLYRQYGFSLSELKLALDEKSNLSLAKDPKQSIAIQSPDKFPLNPNDAKREDLLKVPGIGPKTVEKILLLRNQKTIREFSQLTNCGAILQKAMPFLDLGFGRQKHILNFA